MPQPEGYRKAKRLMELAEHFSLPVITFIDTSGAYPGIEGEERGQSEAIAKNLALMSSISIKSNNKSLYSIDENKLDEKAVKDILNKNTNKIHKSVNSGVLYQEFNSYKITKSEIKLVSKKKPSKKTLEDLIFAYKVAKHAKSNAIVFARNKQTVGIGAGQMNRLDSSRIAARKSEDAAKAEGLKSPLAVGSVVASDAFFPFADGLMAAADAGVTAIIQPGGSIRDEEVIEAANAANLAMIFTGIRHFNH